MKYRELGNTGIMVSEIGFGAWGIGGIVGDSMAYGETNDEDSKKALLLAFEKGINFFDTSPLYGYGHSEKIIGETFFNKRDKIVLATKCGYINFSGEQNFSPLHIKKSLENSLTRLKTDYVDIFQLHDPPIDIMESCENILDVLKQLKDDGKLRFHGVSVKKPQDAFLAIKNLSPSLIQVNFNLVDQRVLDIGLFDICKQKGIGIIVRTPLCFGFLTGKYSDMDNYPEGDHRGRLKKEQIKRWVEASKLFVEELSFTQKQSSAIIALRYILSFDAVTTTIPGMLTKEHVIENVSASDLGCFDENVLKSFREIYKRHNFII